MISQGRAFLPRSVDWRQSRNELGRAPGQISFHYVEYERDDCATGPLGILRRRARCGAGEEESTFSRVLREGCGACEFGAGLVEAA